jgi:hypothetical protein
MNYIPILKFYINVEIENLETRNLEEVAEQFFGDRGFNGASGVFQHAIVD